MVGQGLIEAVPDRSGGDPSLSKYLVVYRVTVAGHGELERQTTGKLGKAFVAMWFNDEMNDAYENSIEPPLMYLG